MGKHSYFHGKCSCSWGKADLIIGNYCSIADALFLLGGNHRIDWVTTFPFSSFWEEFKHIEGHPSTNGNIVVKNDVWVGTKATVLSGVTIHDGAVVAAGSMVTRDIEPYAIYGGNPARLIKYRFTEEQIRKLLEIQWWDWEDEKVKEFVPLLLSDDIDRFIAKANA
jgi:acetyltransferase-like isoleucine patch superfamily enzyme